MVESGSPPNSESDDPLALKQGAPTDAPEAVDDEHEHALVETGEAAGTEDASPGGFDKFRANALAAAGWSLEKASFAAAQGANLARCYPRAALASGLSVLVLGGVLAYSTDKAPNPEAKAESTSQAKAGGKIDPKGTGPDAPGPKQVAEAPPTPAEPAGVEPEQVAKADPDAAASKTPPADPAPSADPAPASERVAHAASLLALPTGPEPMPPVEPVKLTAGIDDSSYPELPAVDRNAGSPTSVDADHEPAPAIVDAPGLGAPYELAKADVKPGEPPHEDATAPAPIPDPTPAAAPISTPDEAKPAPEPEAAPAPESPAPTPAAPTAEPPAPSPSTPAPPQTEAAPTVQPPAPTPGPGATRTPAAEPQLPLAAPAPVVGAAVKETVGALGLGAGLGAAAGAAMSSLGGKPADPSAAEPHDAKPPAPDGPGEPPQVVVPEQAPEPKPKPSEVPAPASPAPNPIPAQAPVTASSPGLLPSLGQVPEGAPASTVDKPSSTPAAEVKIEPKAEPAHPDWVPIRRSGNLVVSDFDRDPGSEDDPFDRRDGGRTTDPDAHADKEMNFSVETYAPRGQHEARGGRGLQASSAAPARPAGKIDTVLHKVEVGENFFSISQSYYSSGRYYRALANANADKFKRPEDLFVGAVIRVPAPEDLDPSYIAPPGKRYGSKAGPGKGGEASQKTADAVAPKAATPIRRSRRSQVELNLPVSDPAAERASDEVGRPAVTARRDVDLDDEPEAASRSVSTRPVHKVQPDETLRTIARDRLGSGRRADEILELNRDTIDDPSDLIVGQILELPDDAKVARPRSRR